MVDFNKTQTICNECAFHVQLTDSIECTHPDESGVNCFYVKFCSSFQPSQEIDSPCVTFGDEQDDYKNQLTSTFPFKPLPNLPKK
jgi:hypothetical protein